MSKRFNRRKWQKEYEASLREKNPLGPAERYLWHRLQRFPDYDWRKGEGPKTENHLWYEQGWEMIHMIQERLFGSGACFGNTWPFYICGVQSGRPLFLGQCAQGGCEEPISCILNVKHTGRVGEDGDEDFDPIPGGHRLLCHDHGYEEYFGKPYVLPSEEQDRIMQAQIMAMQRMATERPSERLELDCGLVVDSFTFMDGPYLARLAELTQEEYDKLSVKAKHAIS